VLLLFSLVCLATCGQFGRTEEPMRESTPLPSSGPTEETTPLPVLISVIPKPVSVTLTGQTFALSAGTSILVEPATPELVAIGEALAATLNRATGFAMQVLPGTGAPPAEALYLTTVGGDPALGDEGYELSVAQDSVVLTAYRPAGLFRGIQTLRQLLPPTIESAAVQPGPWQMPTGTIRDYPRFAWRGAMLDVARHFFEVGDVKRFIDLMVYYKLNRLHLHLSDDQGWRLMIQSWPKLATHGGSTAVGGGPGGFYTQAQYADLVAYAQSRYITIVPEIDMPSHTNAALASYPELNCDGQAPPLYTGIEVGFSSLCIGKEITFQFVDDVVREVANLTAGPYLHIGGDESFATDADDYVRFIERVQAIVQAHGKQMIGWEEIARARLLPTSIAQHWHSDLARTAAEQGAKVILSPATRVYLDMKYNPDTDLGLTWAGTVDVEQAYAWDPASHLDGLSEASILGVEAPLWSETLETPDDIEFMAFPRLVGLAEIGWSSAGGRSWDEYLVRLGAHGPRLQAMGVNFYASPLVPWQ
jgi:hexosaminidase